MNVAVTASATSAWTLHPLPHLLCKAMSRRRVHVNDSDHPNAEYVCAQSRTNNDTTSSVAAASPMPARTRSSLSSKSRELF
jgi:hypothetical protein